MSAPLPGWIAWLLSRRLPDAWREVVLGDLAEEFEARSGARPADARRWLWWQAVRCLVSPPPHRAPAALPSLPVEKHPMLQTLVADVRYAVRVLGRAPSFTLAVVAVLALGIGATTAIFSIVNTVLLRPLPFDEPDRLVRLFHVPPQATFPGMPRFALSPANFYDWQREATRVRGHGAVPRPLVHADRQRRAALDRHRRRRRGLLRRRCACGRHRAALFRPDEDAPGARVVVISDGFWRTEMGGASVLGRRLTLDGEGYTIIGIMPASASLESWGPMARELWVPLALTAQNRAVRDNHNLAAVARLKPGVRADEARSQLEVIARRLEHDLSRGQRRLGRDAGVAPGRHRRRHRIDAGAAARRRRARPAHRLRQRRQPAVHAGARPPQGGRDPRRARRRPPPRPAAAAGRIGGPRHRRWRRRPAAGGGRTARRRGAARRPGAARRRDHHRRHRPAVRARRVDPDGHPRRRGAGAARRRHAADRRAEGGRARRWRDRSPDAAAARRGRGRAVGRAADGGGGDGAQPDGDSHHRRRLRARGRPDDERRACRRRAIAPTRSAASFSPRPWRESGRCRASARPARSTTCR